MSTNGIVSPGAELLYQRSDRLFRPQSARTEGKAEEAEQTAAASAVAVPASAAESANAAASAADSKKVDSYEPANSNKPAYAVDMKQVQQMKAETEARMYDLVRQTLSRQITGGKTSKFFEMFQNIKYTAEDIEQAKKDVAEDGYWGVEQTSDRIVKMAQALTGGDPSKLDSMIQAFEKGFKAAEKAMGGSLPDISQRTRQAVLDKFQALKDQQVQQTQAVQNPNKSAAVSAAAGVS
ncbi:MAG: hypothetical protein IJT94_04750 [Oscillibacter sp.]|nr:hypothetical protein [Oscillibacter sp.]